MPIELLTTDALTNEVDVEDALSILPPLPDNVLVVVRHLQHQITELEARVDELENP